MNHIATISNNPQGFDHPVHVQCTCNTAGDFDTIQQASDWVNFEHFANIGPTETAQLIGGDPTD